MITRAILLFWLGSGFCFLGSVAEGQLIFDDNLEGGAANWSVYSYPGAPACTPLSYVSTATDPNGNHTAGGAFGFEMTRASDRMVTDLNLSSYGSPGLRLSLWYTIQ